MTDTIKITRDHFESMSEFLSAATRKPAWRSATSRATFRPEWFGTPSLSAAVDLAWQGWEPGRNATAKIRDNLTAHTVVAVVPASTMDVAGGYPIAAYAAAGDPLSMVNPAPIEDRARPIVRLVASVSASSSYDAKEILNYGACLAAVVDALESAGFRVELVAANAVRSFDKSQAYVASVTIKRAGDQPDIDRIAFALTHPSMLRRLMFAAQEQHAAGETLFGSNYGVPWFDADMPWLDAGQIFLPGVNIVPPRSPILRKVETAYPVVIERVRRLLTERDVKVPPMWGDTSIALAP